MSQDCKCHPKPQSLIPAEKEFERLHLRDLVSARIWLSDDLRCVRLEGQSDTGSNQAAAEDVHGPLPSLWLGLLARLDAPEPAGGGIVVRAAAALSSGCRGEGSGGGRGVGGLAKAAHGAQGRDGVPYNSHIGCVRISGSVCMNWES